MKQIAIEPGECVLELVDGTFLISQGDHRWIDDRCECGVIRHETNGRYWYESN